MVICKFWERTFVWVIRGRCLTEHKFKDRAGFQSSSLFLYLQSPKFLLSVYWTPISVISLQHWTQFKKETEGGQCWTSFQSWLGTVECSAVLSTHLPAHPGERHNSWPCICSLYSWKFWFPGTKGKFTANYPAITQIHYVKSFFQD